ncbi:MAG TPA: protease inhibitor I42 family protein [Moheibacter sp.]|nr:protease inhibitor I42 family protein [Moheibacter sp.]
MKKYVLLSFAFLTLSSCQTSVKSDANELPIEVNLDQYSDLQKIQIQLGQTILVRMQENPSTGYRLDTKSPQDCVVEINEGIFEQKNTDIPMMGAPGVRTYEVKGVKAGTCLVEFNQTPPGESQPSDKKSIHFVVK